MRLTSCCIHAHKHDILHVGIADNSHFKHHHYSSCATSPLANINVGATRAEVALHSNNLVIQSAQSKPEIAPSPEVIPNIDRARRTVISTNGPVLVKGGGSDDGWLVDSLRAVNVVDAAVRGHLAQLGGAGGWVVGSKVLNDVVLDERIFGPAVDGEVAVAVGVVAAREVDGS